MPNRNSKTVLVINCGSSSLKYQIFEVPKFREIYKGVVNHIGEIDSTVKTHQDAIIAVLGELEEKAGIRKENIVGVGHRVVHGGEEFKEPVVIDKAVISGIKEKIELAPLHNPANLEGIMACLQSLPEVKQVAVFDTAFHHTIPEYAYMYALPYELYKKYRLRKYGFHGTSHAYVAEKAAEKMGKPLDKLKLITVHLGNGSSISAIDAGKCVDTSMGFTPLEGLMMGTRSGDLDPALVLYIINHLHLSPHKVDMILNKESGLLGVSGISNDVRGICKAQDKGNARAKLAIDMFLYRIKKYIGSYMYVLGGADAIVFTAGIGENKPEFVKESTKDVGKIFKKKPKVMVIPTNEELKIAVETCNKIGLCVQG